MAAGRTIKTVKKKSKRRLFLALSITLIVIFGGVGYLLFYNPYQGGLAIDWQLKIVFYDLQTGTNVTLPPGIGVQGEIINNYTLFRYGPDRYAPISTRDTTGTVYVQSTVPTIYTFGDLFNIWGKQFNQKCVPNPLTNFATLYCTRPGEAIVWDADNDGGSYDPSDQVMLLGNNTAPAQGSPLSTDPHIKYVDSDSNSQWDPGETIVYDSNLNGIYDSGDRLIAGTTPSTGTQLKSDSRIYFIDSVVQNGTWDPPILPPAMIDIGLDKERCVNQALGLSANKSWEIIINSPVGVSQHC
ncbi:MAG TPA: hypothetical protein VGS11_06575 [Candidatus Bathyarchaeia archaeon]|nr:hypothetical protein [Candidatus Bathyarchaeia archaeon]